MKNNSGKYSRKINDDLLRATPDIAPEMLSGIPKDKILSGRLRMLKDGTLGNLVRKIAGCDWNSYIKNTANHPIILQTKINGNQNIEDAIKLSFNNTTTNENLYIEIGMYINSIIRNEEKKIHPRIAAAIIYIINNDDRKSIPLITAASSLGKYLQ